MYVSRCGVDKRIRVDVWCGKCLAKTELEANLYTGAIVMSILEEHNISPGYTTE